MLQKKAFEFSSSQIKKVYSKKVDQDKFASEFASSFSGIIKTLVPTVIIRNVSSKYFYYLNDYPTVKIGIEYSIPEKQDSKIYKQDIYTLFKGYSNYLFRFEYNFDEKDKWGNFQEQFFRELKLL